jgi:hypothetical protein
MLVWDHDLEKSLSLTINQSAPFLLFSPPEFREELIMRLVGLFTYCNPRTRDKFENELCIIIKMLKDADFGDVNNNHIYHFQTITRPFYEVVTELTARLTTLEKQVNYLNMYKKSPIAKRDLNYLIPDAVNTKPDAVNTKPDAVNTKPDYQLTIVDTNTPVTNEKKVSKRYESKFRIDRIINYLKFRYPDKVSSLDISKDVGMEQKNVGTEILRIKSNPKHVEKSKHIEIFERGQDGATCRLFRYLPPEE